MTTHTTPAPTTLAQWLAASAPPKDICHDTSPSDSGLLQMLFYGRASTAEHQDPVTSKGWQLDLAHTITEDGGMIVGKYFDTACSRQVPWHQRPQAAALLRAAADPANRINAIVIGEYERAFDFGQLEALRPFLQHHGIQLWMPEAGGPVAFDTPLHDALMAVLAARSHAEVARARHRVTNAMRRQTIDQGYLGGRPPYGYRLVDAGAHPNPALSRRGVRLQQLAPDPATAPNTAWIFAQRLAGHSFAHIARQLNEQSVPGPSGADPGRNSHHTDHGWSLRSVIEIVRNPRYTGHAVWNRASCDRTVRSPTGRRPTTRNQQHEWAISTRIAHQPLVSEQDFLTAQTIRAKKPNTHGVTYSYALSGRLHCGWCSRHMDSHQAHAGSTYRCRHGHSSTKPRPADAARNLYLREDHLLNRIADLLTTTGIATNPTHEQTIRLVRELDLEFTCDRDTITLHQPTTAPSKRTRGIAVPASPSAHSITSVAAPTTKPGRLSAEFQHTSEALTSVDPSVITGTGPVVGDDPRPTPRRHRAVRVRRPHRLRSRHQSMPETSGDRRHRDGITEHHRVRPTTRPDQAERHANTGLIPWKSEKTRNPGSGATGPAEGRTRSD
jgi:site-specific DNA recombinase